MNRALKISFKIIIWIFSIIIGLVLLIFLLLQIPKVQTYVTGKATHFLSDKIKTKVELKKISGLKVQKEKLEVGESQVDDIIKIFFEKD